MKLYVKLMLFGLWLVVMFGGTILIGQEHHWWSYMHGVAVGITFVYAFSFTRDVAAALAKEGVE